MTDKTEEKTHSCNHRFDGQSIDGIVRCHWCGIEQEKLKLYDRADGVRGHYCVGRQINGYSEFWTGDKFSSAGKLYYLGDVFEINRVGYKITSSGLTIISKSAFTILSEMNKNLIPSPSEHSAESSLLDRIKDEVAKEMGFDLDTPTWKIHFSKYTDEIATRYASACGTKCMPLKFTTK